MSYNNVPNPPGRRRSRRAATLVWWLKMGVICFVVGTVVYNIGSKVLMVAHEVREQREAIAQLRREGERLREQNEALRREIQQLHTRKGIILEARRQGYGFPGERLLVVEPQPAQQQTNTPP